MIDLPIFRDGFFRFDGFGKCGFLRLLLAEFANHPNRAEKGNKDRKTTGLMRLRAFADWCFAGDRGEYVVVGGHSLYFRTFFRVFLPRGVAGDMKAKKIANGGVVALTLRRREKEGKAEYRIDPASVKPVYLGWK